MLQKLKELAYRIIEFIAQFEDELVRVWNKPKFVRNSHYVITLDRIAERDIELLKQILAHEGMVAQVEEWRNLGMVGEDFGTEDVWERDLFGERLGDRYQYLPLDTRHVPGLEMAIVSLFDHLDAALDGWLIHSENYQALRTLRERLAGRIKTIYIDPPYNTDASEIMYVNTYKHAAWLSLMDNRLQESSRLMGNDSILCVAIDDSEYHRLYGLIIQIFNEESVLSTVAVRSNPSGRSTLKGFSPAHEYAIFVAGGEDATVGRLPRSEEQIARYDEVDEQGRFEWVNFRKHGGASANRSARPRMFYPIYVSEEGTIRIPRMEWNDDELEWELLEQSHPNEVPIYPVTPDGEERRWKWGHETVQANIEDVCSRLDQTDSLGIYIKSRMKPGTLPSTWWGDSDYSSTAYGTNLLVDVLGESYRFSFPKSVYAVEDILRAANLGKSDLCLDFFAGSGTTAHAVMNLNREDAGQRKYILVEMADYFDDVLLPRVKKVAFSSEWKDGVAQEEGEGMSHFVKYYDLEQYEDALRNAVYVEDAEPFADPYEEVYKQYVFLSDLKQLHALEIDPETHEVRVDLSQLYDDIDLAESLANVRGKRIARLTPDAVTFEDSERIDLRDLDWELIKPLIWW
jgi:adenine-specific DNA-methyltransferase